MKIVPFLHTFVPRIRIKKPDPDPAKFGNGFGSRKNTGSDSEILQLRMVARLKGYHIEMLQMWRKDGHTHNARRNWWGSKRGNIKSLRVIEKKTYITDNNENKHKKGHKRCLLLIKKLYWIYITLNCILNNILQSSFTSCRLFTFTAS